MISIRVSNANIVNIYTKVIYVLSVAFLFDVNSKQVWDKYRVKCTLAPSFSFILTLLEEVADAQKPVANRGD